MGTASRKKVSNAARDLFHKQDGRCHYCDVQMTLRRGYGATVTIDHVKPKSKGGTRHKNNVVGACWACNNARGNQPYDIFKQRVAKVGRPDNKPNDTPNDIRVARSERETPIKLSDAPWKKQKLTIRPYLDDIGKHNTLADAFAAAGFIKKEET